MPWLPLYIDETDCESLLSYLNEKEELAFVVANGPGKWIAVGRIDALVPGRYCLWHTPSGALPLFRGAEEQPGKIENPFKGWSETRAGADSSTPFFGAGHPGTIWLSIRGNETDRSSGLPSVGLSAFEWIGDHYKLIGNSAKPETEKLWKALRRWVEKQATKVPRGGPRQKSPPEIWAFNGAVEQFNNGASGGDV